MFSEIIYNLPLSVAAIRLVMVLEYKAKVAWLLN